MKDSLLSETPLVLPVPSAIIWFVIAQGWPK